MLEEWVKAEAGCEAGKHRTISLMRTYSGRFFGSLAGTAASVVWKLFFLLRRAAPKHVNLRLIVSFVQ